MLSMCHRLFRWVYLFLLGYNDAEDVQCGVTFTLIQYVRVLGLDNHPSTFVCWAWTTTHKVHHKQQVNKQNGKGAR